MEVGRTVSEGSPIYLLVFLSQRHSGPTQEAPEHEIGAEEEHKQERQKEHAVLTGYSLQARGGVFLDGKIK